MNRLKLWLYMVLVLGAGVANLVLVTRELATRALRDADAALQVASRELRTRERLVASEAAAVVALAARSPALLAALAPAEPARSGRGRGAPPSPEPDAAQLETRQRAWEAAAKTAVEQAATLVGVALPDGSFWAAANPEWLRKSAATAAEGPQKEAAAYLAEAAGGRPRRGYAEVNDALWYGVAVPAGRGSALVLFLPLDAPWAAALKAAAGVDVTLDVRGTRQVTTTRPELAKALVGAAVALPGAPVSVGVMPPVQLEEPIRVKVPLLFTRAPTTRAMAVELAGLAKGFAVLSVSTVGWFTQIASYQWAVLVIVVALLLVGLLLGVLVKTEIAPQVPEPLLAAAARIERGDFEARAPVMAGKLGTVAGALNRAVEAAARGGAAPSLTEEFFARGPAGRKAAAQAPAPPPSPSPGPPEASAGAPFAAAQAGDPFAAVTQPRPDARETTSRLDGAQAEPAPGRTASPEPFGGEGAFGAQSFEASVPSRSGATLRGIPAVPLQPAPAGAPAASAVAEPPAEWAPHATEEEHWRAIHAEFLQVRARCGESTEGLGFERFRPKLEKNRDQLIQKYGCRSVRFQVYVKEGKAALKATPVR
jgi:hypothetical protein